MGNILIFVEAKALGYLRWGWNGSNLKDVLV